MNDRVKSVLNQILDQFKSGKIPSVVAYTLGPKMQLPSDNWSFLNRVIMFMGDTADARGFRQWEKVGRHVKKGSKAIYILAPLLAKSKEDPEKLVLIGFKSVPVFKVEDTEGAPLDYGDIKVEELPLIERAREWGIEVRAIPFQGIYYGYFSKGKNQIGLATKEEAVFYHELCHAAESRLIEMKAGQDPYQEIVADLGAQALCKLVGKDGDKFLGNTYRYIEAYSKKINKSPVTACLEVLDRTEKALNLILKRGEQCQDEKGDSATSVAARLAFNS
jgi:hypothetical protein